MKYLKYLAGALLIVVAAFGIARFLFVQPTAAASPQGSTFGDTKSAGAAVVLSAPGANATSTSILNTDSNDRYIISEEIGCENVGSSKTAYSGTGLASLTVTIATSSTAAPATNGNTNSLPVITIGTSTPNFVVSSSTVAAPGNNLVSNIWASGSYVTFTTNATNTAACTVGVRYLPS